jgi:hypothetical protein
LTYKAPQDRDYTATAHFNGATYKVGEGVAWKGVETVAEDDYEAVVADVAGDYSAASDWRKPDYEHLYRVPITRISADGAEKKVYLEGRNFILDGAGYVRPTAVYAWSDDCGDTFHRADGSPVRLPLTVNPAPEHNAEIDCDNTHQHHNSDQHLTRQWWELWLGLIRHAGYRI